jgi:predicted nucleotidyltransferase
MTYGLKEKQINDIKNLLAAFTQIEEAVIYGSRAKGNYKPASDIDMVFKGKNLSTPILNQIANSLDDLLLPYTFDLAIYHHIKDPDVLDHIERVGKVFYEKKVAGTEPEIDVMK